MIFYLTSLASYFLHIIHLYLFPMQRPPGKLSIRIIPEQPVDTPDTHTLSLHWLFGKNGGYVTRLKEDYRQDTPNELFTSAKAEARIIREIADWLQSQECDEFWTPRARQPRRVSYSCNQPALVLTCTGASYCYPATPTVRKPGIPVSYLFKQDDCFRNSRPRYCFAITSSFLYSPTPFERKSHSFVPAAQRDEIHYSFTISFSLPLLSSRGSSSPSTF